MLQRRHLAEISEVFLKVLVKRKAMGALKRQLIITAILLAIIIAALMLRQENLVAGGKAVVELQSESGKPLAIRAEIADTEEETQAGLMFRQSLGKDEGMLFIYPKAAVVNFWMKNTLIPLDMVFISEDFTVVKIHHAVPCTEEPCPLYNSEQPVKYVLEINENLTTAYGIQEGSSRVEIIR